MTTTLRFQKVGRIVARGSHTMGPGRHHPAIERAPLYATRIIYGAEKLSCPRMWSWLRSAAPGQHL